MTDTVNTGLKILVTDDHMVIRQIILNYLNEMGFKNIDMASDSEQAQAKIAEKNYDLIFLDWHMPVKSGYTLLKEYREDRNFDSIAFVMVTAETHEKSVIEALKAGATSYIIKPVKKEDFEQKVNRVLEWIKNKTTGKTASF